MFAKCSRAWKGRLSGRYPREKWDVGRVMLASAWQKFAELKLSCSGEQRDLWTTVPETFGTSRKLDVPDRRRLTQQCASEDDKSFGMVAHSGGDASGRP